MAAKQTGIENSKRKSPAPLGQTIASDSQDSIQNSESEIRGNFFKIALFQITLRTGWIFKTESIVMPAVMDSISGAGWLRGFLPVLNRFGQSIPPLLAAGFVSRTPFKKYVMSACAANMGFCFLALSAIWYFTPDTRVSWLPIVFLILYGLFFVSVGIMNLVLSTLIGKVVRTRQRGRLMLLGHIGGATCAVMCAWFLLSEWINPESGNFTNIFGFAGAAFVFAGLICLSVRETADEFEKEPFSVGQVFRDAFSILKTNRNFRRLAMVGALFGLSITLFPHYQRLGRDRLDVGFDALVPWLIAQNIGVACFSLPSGWIADRFGNRMVLRILLAGLTTAPLLALYLGTQGELARSSYIAVFVLLGLTPVTFRTFSNYTLELVGREAQPMYLSTLSLCIAIPTMVLSPLVGLIVDWYEFEPVFLFVSLALFCSWLLTLGIIEPRKEKESV